MSQQFPAPQGVVSIIASQDIEPLVIVFSPGGLPTGGAGAWGDITGTLADQTDLAAALALKAPLASPALTGTPTAPTAAGGTSTTQVATTAFVGAAVSTHAGATDPHGDRAYADAALATKLDDVAAGTDAEIVGANAAGTVLQRLGYTIATLIAHVVARAQHTGTQLASTISDFASAALAAVTWSTITGKPTITAAAETVLDDTTTAAMLTTLGAQAALVSGTNIKTINSTSLLGSGDIAVSASPGGSSGQIQYNNSSAFGGSPLWVADANTVWQRNSTTAQAFLVSNSYTDASNYSRGYARFASSQFRIGTEQAGTGSATPVVLQVSGIDIITLATTGVTTLNHSGGLNANQKAIYGDAAYLFTSTSTSLTLNATDLGTVYTLNSASDQNWTLPASPTNGGWITVLAGSSKAGSYVRLTANTGQYIVLAAGKSASAGYVRSNSAESYIRLRFVSPNWYAETQLGAWNIDS